MTGRGGLRRSRAIGRGDDAKMCVLAVENRKTFIHLDSGGEDDAASALSVHGALVIVSRKCCFLCHAIFNIPAASRMFAPTRNSSQRNLSTYAESRGTTLNGRRGGKQKQVEGAAGSDIST